MEVLDPLLRENYLTDAEVIESAEHIAHSPVVQELGDRLKQEVVDNLKKVGIDDERLNEYRRIGFARTISHAALSGVMRDGFGRSEMHMAAEVCRVNLAFHHVLKREVDLGFVVPEGLDIVENLRDSGTHGLWRPTDTPMMYPTIDGFPEDRERHFILHDTPQSQKSFHKTWYVEFRNDLFRLTSLGLFDMLEPPFPLVGGGIVAGPNPRFFAQNTKRGSDWDEVPVPDDPRLMLV